MEKFTNFLPPQYYVDVQDDARIHAAALLLPDVKDERLFAFAGTFDINSMLAAFRKAAPNRKFQEDVKDPPVHLAKVPNERALELLKQTGRVGWVTLDETVAALVPSYEAFDGLRG